MLRRRYSSIQQAQQRAAAYASSHLESMCNLDIDSEPRNTRLSGIVCTIGPACASVEMLEKMIDAGMNIARMNFSHGDYMSHKAAMDNVRTAAKNKDKPIAIALDTKGPEIRTGTLKAGVNTEIEIKTGATVTVTTDVKFKEAIDEKTIWVDYKNITKLLEVGKCIYIDDGLICLKVLSKDDTCLQCCVQAGGMLGSKKGCNLPGTSVDLPAITEKDKQDIAFGLQQDVDIIFASFIRDGSGVEEIRSLIGEPGKHIKIISKIENYQGMKNFDEILAASDGIMVARGDLGIELPTEKIFIAQKKIIGSCNRAMKPVICATQMLESMVSKPRPTRAESSDVANAVLDGADCVMLSGETSKGKFPVEAVRTMHQISREAESAVHFKQLFEELRGITKRPASVAQTTAIAAVEAAVNSMATAIIVLTASGKSAQLIASYRPRCPIIAVTKHARVARLLQLWRAIYAVHYTDEPEKEWIEDVDKRMCKGIKEGWMRGSIDGGDTLVLVTGWRQGSGHTNTVRTIIVPDSEEPPQSLLGSF